MGESDVVTAAGSVLPMQDMLGAWSRAKERLPKDLVVIPKVVRLLLDDSDSPEIASYRESFKSFDRNNNGRIGYSCLQSAMRRAGYNPTHNEVLDIINRLDAEKEVDSLDILGDLDFKEFVAIMKEVAQSFSSPEVDYREAFRVFAKTSDGRIPLEEMRLVLHNLPGKQIPDAEVEAMLSTADKNKDNTINYCE